MRDDLPAYEDLPVAAKIPQVKPSMDYSASSRRRALTWASLAVSGLVANLASASAAKLSSGAPERGRTQQQTASDSSAVNDIIMRERLARETNDWAAEAACFHPDAWVEVSWFKGSGAAFVQAAKDNSGKGTVHFDSMSPGVVSLKNDRAIADTACAVHTFSRLDDIEVSITSYTRLLWRVQQSGEQWLICGLRGIYIRDTLFARDPSRVPKLDEEKLSGFRSSYRYLSYILTAGGGPAHNDLPGVDQPEMVLALRAGEREWLEQS